MIVEVNLAYYRKRDWKKFREMIDDPESMHDIWKEWYKSFSKTKRELTKKGLKVNECVIDLNELRSFCLKNGLKNDGKARSQFVSGKRG